MDEKERLTITVDGPVARSVQSRETLNVSALCNKMLTEYVAGGELPDVAIARRTETLQAEIEQLESEIALKETTLAQKQEELRTLRDVAAESRTETADEIDAFVAKVEAGTFPEANLKRDNSAVMNHATKAGVTAERFVAEAKHRLNGGR
jgi:hypothetical protein